MQNFSNLHKIAKNYSKALHIKAVESKNLDLIYQNFKEFVHIYNNIDFAKKTLDNQLISNEKKIKLVDVFFNQLTSHQDFRAFIYILIKSNRIMFLNDIFKSFVKSYNNAKNILEVELITDKVINKADEERIIHYLESKYKKIICVNKKIDSEILGGFVLKIGSKIIDASLINNILFMKDESKKAVFNYIN